MRPYALILFLLAAAVAAGAEETNYYCVVCGKGPLTGKIWLSKWGAVCDDCAKLENHCSLCGLPIRDGDGSVKTGDGRYICKFDRTNAVLDADAAREVFEDATQELASLFGPGFELKYPAVTVNLFDVDYWSEKGREDGLHKFGFSYTRKTPGGVCTHEVVMLSGQLRDNLAATAAHEYMHLWINENLPTARVIDSDTTEAICELTAYELMGSRKLSAQQKRILENPYTHGQINRLVEVETEHGGFNYILDWVKDGAGTNFETAALAAPARIPALMHTNVPPPLPVGLKLAGLLEGGARPAAIISGVSFLAGETRAVKLRDRTVQVRCREIRHDAVVLEVQGLAGAVTLQMGEERFIP